MILSLKVLAAAGLAASVATGGAIATRPAPDNHPAAATASPAAAPAVDDGRHEEINDDHGDVNDDQGDVNDDHGDDAGDDHGNDNETVTTAVPPAPTVSVQTAGDAGTVTLSINGGTVTITGVQANAGWVAETERAAGREVEVSFRNGLRRIDFKAEVEDGRLETRVRERTIEREGTPAATAPTTPTTIDDRDDNDEGVTTPTTRDDGDRIGQVDGDHSGPGGGGDDHSGSGRSGGSDDH